MPNLKTKLSRYSKVIENYLFMTFSQGAGLLVGLLLYPYLIRVLGGEVYGTYIFALSNVQFFTAFISFGFAMPALKKIALFPDDLEVKSRTVSEVLVAKCYLLLLSIVVLVILLLAVPFVQQHYLLYLIVSSTVINEILFPVWYFQGIQKMKFVTCVNLSLRFLTIPFIFIFIKTADDLLKYAAIASVIPLSGGIFTMFYLKIKENIQFRFVSLSALKPVFRDALPFFWTAALGTVKSETVTFVIGTFFNMKDVALYDLANKIVSIPRLMITCLNAALFPSVVKDIKPVVVKKIIRYERLIGIVIMGLIAAFGYWAVLLFGGADMIGAYPLAIVLSLTIYTYLEVGCYINYIFVPQNRYYFVTKNQFVALVSFLIMGCLGAFILKNILLIVLAYSLAGIVEIVYCRYLIIKHQLL
ncbi:teichoic acid transporter [Bacteroidia bacterium]|nr:teichoic acid transporter [Bacteroidia bacterium]